VSSRNVVLIIYVNKLYMLMKLSEKINTFQFITSCLIAGNEKYL